MDYATGLLFKAHLSELAREAAEERLARDTARRAGTSHRPRFHWRSPPRRRPRPRTA